MPRSLVQEILHVGDIEDDPRESTQQHPDDSAIPIVHGSTDTPAYCACNKGRTVATDEVDDAVDHSLHFFAIGTARAGTRHGNLKAN
jgi:hypothetical protein